MSVSVDQPDRREAALKFLKQQSATFPNYWLDEHESVWQARFDINGPPTVFVFNRKGQQAAKFVSGDPPYTYEQIEQVVKDLLKAPE
jgi:hypothetical protein